MHDRFQDYNRQYLFELIAEKRMKNTPWCLFRLPGEDDYHVVSADYEVEHEFGVMAKIKPWQSSEWLCFSSIKNYISSPMVVCPRSTSRDNYLSAISSLIKEIKPHGEKTVICRNICGDFKNFNLQELIENYFESTKGNGALTFIFWHPVTEYWMGSTPELILERAQNGRYHTIALAGTRRCGLATAWDAKNVEEHEIVADDIERKLTDLGLKPKREDRSSIAYGNIEHLCTHFYTDFVEDYTRDKFDATVDAIQPTPAVAGFPLKRALEQIGKYESWPRYCYGGVLDIGDIRLNMAYGVLRCVHFNTEKWAIYTGSGITSQSNPEDEWNETEAKARPLIKVLENR